MASERRKKRKEAEAASLAAAKKKAAKLNEVERQRKIRNYQEGQAIKKAEEEAARIATMQALNEEILSEKEGLLELSDLPEDDKSQSLADWKKADMRATDEAVKEQKYKDGFMAYYEGRKAGEEKKPWWKKAVDWASGDSDKITNTAKVSWDAGKMRNLNFTQLDDGHISVSAQTPSGTRIAYRADLANEGFEFVGTRYNPSTVSNITARGLLKGAISKSSLIFAGAVSLGQNLMDFGRGKEFASPEYWDSTVMNSEFWVSTGVDSVVSIAVGASAAALVGGVLVVTGAVVALPVAIVATAVVGVAIGFGVEASGFSQNAKGWVNGIFD